MPGGRLSVGLVLALALASVAFRPAVEANAQAVRQVQVADYRTDGRSDAEAIQAAIDAADPGDTVLFGSGVYVLDEPIYFGSGVRHLGAEDAPATLRGAGDHSLRIIHTADRPLQDTTIRGLRFENIELAFKGTATDRAFEGLTLADCVFENARRSEPWTSDFLALSYAVGTTVDGCVFLRGPDHGGRGVTLYRTRSTVIKDSFFGTTPDLEPGTPYGHFKTAINVFGYDVDNPELRNEHIVIDGNVWRRTPGLTCPPEVKCEDHGVYAWGVRGLYVLGNQGDGWSNTASGGALKIRNGDDYFVLNNRFMTSGILTYTYPHHQAGHLNHERVEGNRIDMLGDDDAAKGIFYRRVDASGSSAGTVCDGAAKEDDIYLLGNRFVDGGNIDVRCAVGPEVCVEGNAGADLNLHVSGVRTSGCEVPGTWDVPLAGIHRGDFNGDGREDFAHLVTTASGARHWLLHLTDGRGYVGQIWDEDIWPASDTEDFGVHVSDFDGDGKDDITYYGRCGGDRARCWRMHRSTGAGFAAARHAGTLSGTNRETLRFGVHTGDFDGDGRGDLVFRGACDSGDACWRVLRGQSGGTFAPAENWGDGAAWHPVLTDEYGLLIGDFNGDERDDIGYRGTCGGPEACLRVHVSTTANVFVAQDRGSRFYDDGSVSPHFAMRVLDHDGDGRDDIAYRGKCGNPGMPQWRVFRGAVTGPMPVTCAQSLADG